MCVCEKPTKNGEGSDRIGKWHLSPPSLYDGETVVFDEPGRCCPQVNGTGSTDYHAYHFHFIDSSGMYKLRVRHGGGEEVFEIGYAYTRIKELLEKLDSDGRFLMLHAFMTAHHKAARTTREAVTYLFQKAFIDGRLKKRKYPKRGIKVWIEPNTQTEVLNHGT